MEAGDDGGAVRERMRDAGYEIRDRYEIRDTRYEMLHEKK
jgi:hypothetical protein